MNNLPNSIDNWQSDLFYTALATRTMLEQAWSPETAFQGIELQPDDPPSRGQCGVSSLWLARHLCRQGFEVYFTEGLIRLDDLNDDHVWVEARQAGHEPQVIDITSDQYQTTNRTKVHVGAYELQPGTVGSYEPQQYFAPDEVPRRKLLARFAILEANIARLPKRHRLAK